MKYAGFVGQTYSGMSLTAAGDRSINLYPESTTGGKIISAYTRSDGAEAPEAAYVLNGTPGTSLFAALPTKPLQRVYTEPNTTRVFAVSGSVLYELASGGTYTTIGAVDSGPYRFTSNAVQMMLSCGGPATAFIFTMSTSVLARVSASQFMGSADCTMIDNYFIARVPNSRKFQISSILDGTTWDGLDFALAEGGADNLVGMIADHRELWLFGSRHAEVFTDTGNANFPFEPAEALYLEQGLAGADAVTQLDNTIFWLAQNQQGQCRVFRANGYQPLGVSNRSTEWFFNQYAKHGGVSDAVMHGYQNEDGHSFLVISFPSATSEGSPSGGTVQNVVNGATWVYDVTENQWHERAAFVNGVMGAHVGRYHTFGFGRHLVGGGDGTGNVYVLSEDVYQDAGAPIKRVRRAPHMVDELKVITYHKLRLSAQVGIGPVGDPNNQMVLRVSNNGGATWGNEYSKPIGDPGNYEQIIEWRMLGRSMRRSFEVSTTVNGPVCLVDAFLEIAEGTR